MSHIYWAVHKGAKHVTKHAYHRSHGDLENFKHAKLEGLWSAATWSHTQGKCHSRWVASSHLTKQAQTKQAAAKQLHL